MDHEAAGATGSQRAARRARRERCPLGCRFSLASVLALTAILIPACTPRAQPEIHEPEHVPVDAAAVRPTLPLSDPTATPIESAAITVSPDDAAIEVLEVDFPGEGAMLHGYLARPRRTGPFPVILVAHDRQGLTEHFRDVARRLAKAGYLALAVDFLSREGGVPQASASGQIPSLEASQVEQSVSDFQSALRYLQMLEDVRAEQAGVLGFGLGGVLAWHVVAQTPSLHAAAIFYATPPPVEQLVTLHAAVLGLYGGQDDQAVRSSATVEAALRARHATFERVVYPAAAPGFHDDTDPRYNPSAARDAWEKTLAWFQRYIRE